MKNVLDYDEIYAEDDAWEMMDENQGFNEFVGKCITHFVHFVVPRRDQGRDIQQDYEIPENIDVDCQSRIMLTRENGNKIRISFWTW